MIYSIRFNIYHDDIGSKVKEITYPNKKSVCGVKLLTNRRRTSITLEYLENPEVDKNLMLSKFRF